MMEWICDLFLLLDSVSSLVIKGFSKSFMKFGSQKY